MMPLQAKNSSFVSSVKGAMTMTEHMLVHGPGPTLDQLRYSHAHNFLEGTKVGRQYSDFIGYCYFQ